MFNKEEFEKKMQLERERQIDEVSKYLNKTIKVNANIRNMKLNVVPDKETLDYISNIKIPINGRDPKEIASELEEYVFSKSMLIQHPRFYSFVASGVSPYSLFGAIMSDIYNIHGGGFDLAPGATLIEEKLIKWMGSLIGYDTSKCGGLFTSGGSSSTLTALVAARDAILKDNDYSKGIAYISDQTHSSVIKAFRIIGIRDTQVRIIPTDEQFKMKVDELEKTIIDDKKKGLIPFVIVGTVGTTNTGSIDPIEKLAEIKDKYQMWLHIDGAYGGSILFSDIYKNLAKGVNRSDSMSWDTHKWAMQTYSSSSVILKDKQNLITSFNEHPEYLEDIRNMEHTDPWDMGVELSRPHRALKFWFTIQALGKDKLAEIIEYSIYNSKVAYRELIKNENVEIVSMPSCAALTFRYIPKSIDPSLYDALNADISNKVIEDEYCYVVTTFIKNKKVLRLCFVNGNTTTDDVVSSMQYINDIAGKIIKKYEENNSK